VAFLLSLSYWLTDRDMYESVLCGAWRLVWLSAGDITDSNDIIIIPSNSPYTGTEVGSEDLIRYNKNLLAKNKEKRED
jgi:hypothetical protein